MKKESTLLKIEQSDIEIFKIKKNFINLVQIIFKTSQLHDINNIALKEPINHLISTIIDLCEDQREVSLFIASDYLTINEEKVRMDIEIYTGYMYVMDELKKREIQGISFSNKITPDSIRKFLGAFNNLTSQNTFDRLSDFLKENNIPITLTPILAKINIKQFDTSDVKEIAKQTYTKTLSVVNEAMESLKVKQVLNIKETKKAIQKMVNNLLREESTLMGLTTLKCHDEYTYNHSVNVCILALAIGQRLGYSKHLLAELGMAALFHDIGKSSIPLKILNKTTEFTPEEWEIMRKHPVYGVKNLLKLKGINRLALKILTGSFEHHLNYDLSGYPVLKNYKNVSIYGRIISIVDCYDALTDTRVYNRTPFPPPVAVRMMLSKTGQAFDPVLMKIFINTIGLYPVGSLVILNTKELGIVIKTNPNPELNDRPRIKLLNNNSEKEEIIDLSEKNQNGKFARHVIKTVSPHKYGINIAKFFV